MFSKTTTIVVRTPYANGWPALRPWLLCAAAQTASDSWCMVGSGAVEATTTATTAPAAPAPPAAPAAPTAPAATMEQQGGVVALDEVRRYAKECMERAGADEDHAISMADVLVAADYRGFYSHGLNRLDMYVKEVQAGLCDITAKPKVLQETAATAWVDGCNGMGPVVGNFCMQLAIQKARDVGVGWVAAKGSNHFGIAGWYSHQALDNGMIGMAFTNTSPLMSPTRSKGAALGTNPIAVAGPASGGDSFSLDMATTATAVGKIEVKRRRNDPIPEGWAQDTDGNPTLDAHEAMRVGCLMPLGGKEASSGYKGYGLGLMVELFCGVLAGAEYGPGIRKWLSGDMRPANLGQSFVALDPARFAPGFDGRLGDLLAKLRGMAPAQADLPVMVAGDQERAHMAEVDAAGGVQYHESQLQASEALAKQLGVEPMRVTR